MAKKDDAITSTEKLLDLIRKKKPSDRVSSVPSVSSPVVKGRPIPRPRIGNLVKFQKKVTVGVSIGRSELKLVKVDRSKEKNQELIDYISVPLPPQISAESAQFPLFLKRVLTQFCGDAKTPEIWSSISSAKVEMRYLRIPKVPRRQITNTVYWTFKRDVSFNEKEEIFDFFLLGDVIENGIQKTEVMAYTGPSAEIEKIRNAFASSGFPLTGITIVPFLLQNLLRSQWLQTKGKNVCSLYIGRDWSRIDIFSNGHLVLSRGIKAGIRSMIESIREHIADEPEIKPGEGAEDELALAPEPEDFNSLPQADQARQIFSGFIRDTSSSEEAPPPEYSHPEVFEMILPALSRLVRQVDRTLEHYTLKFDSEGIDRIYLSGLLNTQLMISSFIADQLGLATDVFDPMGPESPISGNIEPPATRSERESYLPAVGLALSDNSHTPNFIFTYRDKNWADQTKRINSGILSGLLVAMAVCIGIFLWQNQQIDQKELQIYKLQSELDSYSPRVDTDMIAQLLNRVKKRQQGLKSLGLRYKTVAVLNEVSRMTPPEIRLLSVNTEIPAPQGGDPRNQVLKIEGIIFGDRLAFESSLAEYLLKLDGSPLLKNFSIKKRTVSVVDNKEVLHFAAQLEIV